MFKEIKFNKQTRFLGRNGVFKADGLQLNITGEGQEIMIEPITSQGKIGRCTLWIPMQSIGHLTHALSTLKLEAEGTPEKTQKEFIEDLKDKASNEYGISITEGIVNMLEDLAQLPSYLTRA